MSNLVLSIQWRRQTWSILHTQPFLFLNPLSSLSFGQKRLQHAWKEITGHSAKDVHWEWCRKSQRDRQRLGLWLGVECDSGRNCLAHCCVDDDEGRRMMLAVSLTGENKSWQHPNHMYVHYQHARLYWLYVSEWRHASLFKKTLLPLSFNNWRPLVISGKTIFYAEERIRFGR